MGDDRHVDLGDVEIVGGLPSDDDFEELPGGEPGAFDRHRRLVLGLGGAAVLVALVVASVLRDTPRQPSSSPTSLRSSTSVAVPAPVVRPQPVDEVRALALPDADCPRRQHCVRVETVPDSVLRAVRTILPDSASAVLSLVTGTLPPLLHSRVVEARSETVQLIVRVRAARSTDGPRESAVHEGTLSNVFLEAVVGRWDVQVQSNGPTGSVPDLGVLRALSRDRRLLALR